MDQISSTDRRDFLKTGVLAAGTVFFGSQAMAEEAAAGAKLPELGYEFGALEPHIDAKTMEIHHGKHHAAYVKGLNGALEKQAELKKATLDDLMAKISSISDEDVKTAVRNNGGGHWNHSFFWKSLTPAKKQGEPSAKLAEAISDGFGSMDEFRKIFGEAAGKRFGSGWAWLIARDGKLKVVSTPNQDNPLMRGIVPDADAGIPILGLDVWEHAYYLHYQSRRPDYVKAWWNVVDWQEVSRRFDKVVS